MTAGAGACDIAVIETRWLPGRHGMAGIAGRIGSDVRGRFTGGGLAVMAAAAHAGSRAMIECRPCPCSRRLMTGFAGSAGSDVRGRLAARRAAVVATGAGTDHYAVIDSSRLPGSGEVAIFTA